MCGLLCGLSLAIPGGLTAAPWHFWPGLVAAFHGGVVVLWLPVPRTRNYFDLKGLHGGAWALI